MHPLTPQRLISEEPMAMVINFGMSENFQTVDYNHLSWPAQLLVDYVRVYQRSDGKVGCDPADRPTADYISRHMNAYSNPNLTTWEQAGYAMPKNSLIDKKRESYHERSQGLRGAYCSVSVWSTAFYNGSKEDLDGAAVNHAAKGEDDGVEGEVAAEAVPDLVVGNFDGYMPVLGGYISGLTSL
ncbi:hypothetical protein EHS25_007285 [Saitozyma podzolica]|uniref:GH16 domain-containing protein n=1 Tax=Saitozyma podzolica TaxID=1890683 RepID=A0A427XMN7_9TREE|nr:hypothetical protein EHS25_007285 [Saitozyma podzolica]